MTGNLQEIFHQVESKRQKNCASIRWEIQDIPVTLKALLNQLKIF